MTTYHPQGYGIVERLAGTLKGMQRQSRGDKPITSWDEPLKKVQYIHTRDYGETLLFLMHRFKPGVRGLKRKERYFTLPDTEKVQSKPQEIDNQNAAAKE